MVISQTVPLIFIYPLLMMWLGFGIAPRILVVIIVCLFPVAVNLVDGLAYTDRDYLDLFRSMGADKRRIFFFLKWPGALPLFFSGLKISATYCIMGAVIAEWMGGGKGIGMYMLLSYKSFIYSRVYASIFTAVVLSLIIFGIIILLERTVLSWKFVKKGDIHR
jgi:ABC-type nitrate/sulfonate/bicarbonate transport system permease component